MADSARFPQSYENVAVRRALQSLVAAPSMERLSELLTAAQKGGLTVDVTGSAPGSVPVARTLVSTDGKLVLPLFTSVKEMRAAIAKGGGKGQLVRALTLPARDALELVRGQDCAAVQFNPGSQALVVAREHIEAALDAEQQ